jgi:UDP-N-acetylglucosamine 2-epimerase (non-hydrolysing)
LKSRRVVLIAGARPNFMKAAPVLRALEASAGIDPVLVHTGQHYDAAMSDAFFADLEMPAPDVSLSVGSGTHAAQTARVMVEFERYLSEASADIVAVIGDVNSTLGCAVVAAKLGPRVAHIEAGLRSFDRTMPEEINRLVADSVATILFTTSADADDNLLREGHPAEQIHFVGNTMIDSLERYRDVAADPAPIRALGVAPGAYLLVTLHRPGNVDDPERLARTLAALATLPIPVVFPMHPRTRAVADGAGLGALLERLRIIPPASYLTFLRLQLHARLVLTDSGGVQEETTVLGVPCLTFRDNTERPVTITHGTNRLIGTDPERIRPEVMAALERPPQSRRVPPLWDGRAAERIAEVLARID